MGIEKMELWQCDICGTKEYGNDTNNPPWIKFNIMLERDFITKIICWYCCEEIKSALEKANPVTKANHNRQVLKG